MLLPEGGNNGRLRQHLRSRGCCCPRGATTGICSGVASARFTRVLLPEGPTTTLARDASWGSRGCCCPRGQQHAPRRLMRPSMFTRVLLPEGATTSPTTLCPTLWFTRVPLPEGATTGKRRALPLGSRGCCCPRGQQLGERTERVMRSRGCCCPRGQQRNGKRSRRPPCSRGCCCPRGQQHQRPPRAIPWVHEGVAARGGNNRDAELHSAKDFCSRGCCCPRGQQRAMRHLGGYVSSRGCCCPRGQQHEACRICKGSGFTRVLLPEGATTANRRERRR